MDTLSRLLRQVETCDLCARHLDHPPRPVVRASETARILVVGQAPGRLVHETGIPFNDPSGDRLRQWMGVSRDEFYDVSRIALVPMGFCYPGKGSSGDLPPRKECAEAWRRPLLAAMPGIELTLLAGSYAVAWHLPATAGQSLSSTVSDWQQYAPGVIPMPHPSPRNNLWLRRHPWFEAEVVAWVRLRVRAILDRR